MLSILELVLGMLLVLISATLFVNALEYLGSKFKFSSSFVGAILSPIFTSLPELVVFLVAIFSGVKEGDAIGLGTIFGQPFMASSLSYSLVGIAAYLGYKSGRRDSKVLYVDRELVIPYVFITILFPLTLIPAVFRQLKIVFGFFFLASFVIYMYMMYSKRKSSIFDSSEKPYLNLFNPTLSAFIQLIIAVLILYYGSEKLVSAVSDISSMLRISPLGLSLILIPAATAIPETASALIWGYKGRDTLSLGALVGEKILYSSFYPGIGLFITTWTVDFHAFFSVVTTTVVSLVLLYFIRKEKVPWYVLLIGVAFFVAYSLIIFI